MARTFMFKVYFELFLCIAALISSTSATEDLNYAYFKAQRSLVDNIVSGSEVKTQILPMNDSSTPVLVRVGLGIRQIATVDEVNQAMRLNAWLRLYWNNPFLIWKPEEYANVTSVHLDNSLLWTPDIAMYNKASLEEEIDILYKRLSTSVIVEHDGNCTWLCPVTLLSQCKINVREFPFDEQICLLTFGSWTYSVLQIDVDAAEVDLDSFIENGEWSVVDYPMKRNVRTYGGGTYPDVTLSFRIQRQPLYYSLNLIMPCTVISVLAFLSFVLPSNHGERVSLVITVLLAMSVYMLIVSSTLPQTSDAMPVIGSYFLCIIVEIALCLLATCFVAKLRDHHTEIPRWLDELVNKRLAKLLFMSSAIEEYEILPKLTQVNGHVKTNDVNLHDVNFAENDIMKATEVANQRALQTFHNEISVLTNDVTKRQRREAKERKWQRAASVMDRFFLVFFSILFVVITASVFS